MKVQKLFTRLVLLASVVCLAAFAWADGSNVNTVVNGSTIKVDNSTALRAAVLSDEYSIIEISKDAKINMGTKKLSIPAGRTVTLSLDEGSSLDFSGVNEQMRVYSIDVYVGIYNLGDLTITGSGDIAISKDNANTSLICCSDDANLEVAGCVFSAKVSGDNLSAPKAPMTILNTGCGKVTVRGGTLLASNKVYASPLYNYGCGTVTVIDGTISANDAQFAHAVTNHSNGAVTVLSGNLTGDLVNTDNFNGTFSIHGGSFDHNPRQVIVSNDPDISADCVGGACTVTSIAPSSWHVSNNVTISADDAVTVKNDGTHYSMNAVLLSDDVSLDITDVSIISGCPKGLNVVSGDSGTIKFMASQNCTPGSYNVTILAKCTKDGKIYATTKEPVTVTVNKADTSSGSSGGCNVGFSTAALALASLAFIPIRRKRK